VFDECELAAAAVVVACSLFAWELSTFWRSALMHAPEATSEHA